MKKAKKKQNHSLSTEATLPTMATLVEVVLPAMDLLAGRGGRINRRCWVEDITKEGDGSKVKMT